MSNETSRVYVGTYAKYSEGSLFGKWIDLDDYSDSVSFLDACKELHKDENDPELMFQDVENVPSGMISESHIDDGVWEWINLDEDEKAILKGYQEVFYSDGTLDKAQDAFRGEWKSFRDFAETIFDESNEIPDHLAYYIDYDAVVRAYEDDYISVQTDGGDVLVYDRHC